MEVDLRCGKVEELERLRVGTTRGVVIEIELALLFWIPEDALQSYESSVSDHIEVLLRDKAVYLP